MLLGSDRPNPRHTGERSGFGVSRIVSGYASRSEPGCVSPVDAQSHFAPERQPHAASTGAARSGSLDWLSPYN